MAHKQLISLTPQQIEEFISKAALGFNLTIDAVKVSSNEVFSGEVDIQSPGGVRFQLSSGVLKIFSNSGPKAVFQVKINSTIDTYISVGDAGFETQGIMHFIFNRVEFEIVFSVKQSIQEILGTF